jgi:hypothetical protein
VPGLLLVAVGVLVATGRLHGRRKAPVPAGDGQPQEKVDSWAQRVLAEPRLGLAMLAGALAGLPGAAYLSALHNLVTGKSSTAAQVVAVILFVLIEFLLIIIPLRVPGTAARGHQGGAQACSGLAGGPRPPAHGLHRPDPGRLPGDQRPGAPDLTRPAPPVAAGHSFGRCSVLNHRASQHMSLTAAGPQYES